MGVTVTCKCSFGFLCRLPLKRGHEGLGVKTIESRTSETGRAHHPEGVTVLSWAAVTGHARPIYI
jgi:hypothetical protein